jgi:hypothetical protein
MTNNREKVILTGDFDKDKDILDGVFIEQAELARMSLREAEMAACDMLHNGLEYAVHYFNGWFGEEVDLILPERRREEDRLLREAQDDIDKADWT